MKFVKLMKYVKIIRIMKFCKNQHIEFYFKIIIHSTILYPLKKMKFL